MKLIAKALIVVILFSSCSNSRMKNKTYFLLNASIGVMAVLHEYQITFLSDDVVEFKTTLSANCMLCTNYKNDPTILEKSTLRHYTYSDNIISIPELNLTLSVKETEDGNLVANTGEVLYTKSIVEYLGQEESIDRVKLACQDVTRAYDVFTTMLDNDNKPSFNKNKIDYTSEDKSTYTHTYSVVISEPEYTTDSTESN
jgi:hypothetical protein